MARIIDTVSITIVTILLVFVWCTAAISNWLVCLFIALVAGTAVATVAQIIFHKNAKPYPVSRFETELAIRGNEYLVSLLLSTSTKEFEHGENYILFDDSILICAFKLNQLNAADLCAAIRLAKQKERAKIYLVCSKVERKAYRVVSVADAEVRVVRIKTVFAYLKKHAALPPLKKTKRVFGARAMLEAMLQRSSFRNYAFSGAVLVTLSLFTPLKIYYAVIGSVSLFLAVLTLSPLGKGDLREKKVLEKL